MSLQPFHSISNQEQCANGLYSFCRTALYTFRALYRISFRVDCVLSLAAIYMPILLVVSKSPRQKVPFISHSAFHSTLSQSGHIYVAKSALSRAIAHCCQRLSVLGRLVISAIWQQAIWEFSYSICPQRANLASLSSPACGVNFAAADSHTVPILCDHVFPSQIALRLHDELLRHCTEPRKHGLQGSLCEDR